MSEQTFPVGAIRADVAGGVYRLWFEDSEEPGRLWFHALTGSQACELAQQLCYLLADSKPAELAAAEALASHPARVRERELPALRANRGEVLAAWCAKNGGDAA